MQLDELIGKYVALRDKKAEITAEHKVKVGKIDEVLTKIEGALLRTFESTGTESVRTEFGTAFKATTVSITAADKSAFLDFIKEKDAWPLLDVRPLKSAVVEYQENSGDLPPGLSMRSEIVVQIRRS